MKLTVGPSPAKISDQRHRIEQAALLLLTAEMSLPLSRERGAPVVQVNSYAESGELTDADFWVVEHEGKWRRCAD